MSEVRKPGLFYGSAVDMSLRGRVLAFLSLLLLSGSLCFSQFGIMAYDSEMVGSLNFMLFLIPVVIAVVMLGAIPGICLAFATGLLIMFRAQWTPTSMYDTQMADPFLSVVSITLAAMVMSIVVIPAARRWPPDYASGLKPWERISPIRYVSIAIGCLVFALVFSYGTRGLMYLFVTPGGEEYGYATTIAEYQASMQSPLVFIEALINAVIFTIACAIPVTHDASRCSGTWKSGLNSAFTRWLSFAMVVVFMLSSSVSFCMETIEATDEANGKIMSDLGYLENQVNDRVQSGASVESVAVGFSTSLGGDVYVIHDRKVVSSNDEDCIGLPASEILGSQAVDNYEFLLEQAEERMLMGVDEHGAWLGVRALVNDDYTFIEMVPLSAVFKSRTVTLLYNGTSLLIMLTVVFLLANYLLRRIVVKPIHRTNDVLDHITNGELSRRIDERDVIEFDELSTGINTTVSALKSTIAEVEQRNAQDLNAAKAIQESALPRAFPPFPENKHFDIYASMKTAKEVGGDFYDFFLVDDDKLAFLIADVSGKGIPAALFMMTAKTQLKNFLSAGMTVDEAVNAANHQLCMGNDAGMFVTVFACVLDYESGLLSYVNAGHNPPLLHHDGEWDWLRDVSGMPLGLFDGLPYDRFDYQLAAGDTLYLYTDGVTEAMSAEGELFGEDRLLETLECYTGMNARTVSVGIRRAITDFTLDAEQSDDITMLTMRYGVPPENRAVMVLPADVKQLVHVYNFIHEELHRRNAPQSVYNPLDIAAEELFVNVCHYAYPEATPEDPGEVRIGFEYEAAPPSLTITIEDDGIPYDPLAKPDAVTPDDIASVPIGGLGILMAKKNVDEMYYERVGESNILTFRKGW